MIIHCCLLVALHVRAKSSAGPPGYAKPKGDVDSGGTGHAEVT